MTTPSPMPGAVGPYPQPPLGQPPQPPNKRRKKILKKKIFIVEVHGDARELYQVAADDEDEASKRWADHSPFLTEVSSAEVYSVSEVTA